MQIFWAQNPTDFETREPQVQKCKLFFWVYKSCSTNIRRVGTGPEIHSNYTRHPCSYLLCRRQSRWICWRCFLRARVLVPGPWPCWSLLEPCRSPPRRGSWRCAVLQTTLSPLKERREWKLCLKLWSPTYRASAALLKVFKTMTAVSFKPS